MERVRCSQLPPSEGADLKGKGQPARRGEERIASLSLGSKRAKTSIVFPSQDTFASGKQSTNNYTETVS